MNKITKIIISVLIGLLAIEAFGSIDCVINFGGTLERTTFGNVCSK